MAILRAHPRTATHEADASDFSFAPTVIVDRHEDTMTPTAPLPCAPAVIATPVAFHVPTAPPPDAPIAARAKAAVERTAYDAAAEWAETRELWASTAYVASTFAPVHHLGPVPLPAELAHDLGRARVVVRRAWLTWSYWTWEWPDIVRATAIGAIVFSLVTTSAAALGAFRPPQQDRVPRVVQQHTAGPTSDTPPTR